MVDHGHTAGYHVYHRQENSERWGGAAEASQCLQAKETRELLNRVCEDCIAVMNLIDNLFIFFQVCRYITDSKGTPNSCTDILLLQLLLLLLLVRHYPAEGS